MKQIKLSGYSIEKSQLDKIIKEYKDLPIHFIVKKIKQCIKEK